MAIPIPAHLNKKADFLWEEVITDPTIGKHKWEDEFRRRCNKYGLSAGSNAPHDNVVIQRYLMRNRIWLVKEFHAFYRLIQPLHETELLARLRKVEHTYPIHPDKSFKVMCEMEFYKIELTPHALDAALRKLYYRTVTPTTVEKYLLQNRLLKTSVTALNNNKVSFTYEIRVLQPLWLPERKHPWSKSEVTQFIERKIWMPIAMTHRFTDIKLRTFL